MAKVEEKRSTLPKADFKDVLREMLLIRRFEEKVEERFRAGEPAGFLHADIGPEAVAVGVCHALGPDDVTRDPIRLLRERLELSDEDWQPLEAEAQRVVEASVEFAKAGTDPKPEDALKNIYAG